MKFPNWLRILWWLLITSLLSAFLVARLPDFLIGKNSAGDVLALAIWTALMLAPLFSEVSLLGITLKQEIEELKTSVSNQIGEIKTEIRSAVDVRTTLSQQFNIPAPVTDAQLPELEQRVKAAVLNALSAHGISEKSASAIPPVSSDVNFLFSTRYNIERELRRIASGREVVLLERRPLASMQLVRWLVELELINPSLASAIREVYAVCSPAIHGETVSDAKISFVRDVGPQLISALRSIQ